MARSESDREDLMREATALHRRAEFRLPHNPETVIAGYRRDGSLSIYFGPDPCFHFDPQLRLRRAYIDECLYRTQGETLARLNRVRSASGVELQRHDLTPRERDDLVEGLAGRLQQLLAALQTGANCLACVPAEVDLRDELSKSLTSLTSTSIRLAPAIRGKR